MGEPGTVYLVGAGPGDPGLLTLRGRAVLDLAQVVVYDGLVSAEIVAMCPASAERIYAGKKRSADGAPLTQTAINALLITRARAGKQVVRLKGGDPFLFGRGGEECEALCAAGIPFEVVPGVSAVTAVPAYAGIPLTLRGVASSVAVATGHGADDVDPIEIDWAAAAGADTVVLFMSLLNAQERAQALIAGGKSAETPVAAISWGTLPRQRVVIATLATIGEAIGAAALRPPALLVVGEVVRCARTLDWYGARAMRGANVLATRPATELAAIAEGFRAVGAACLPAPVTCRVRRKLGLDAAALRQRMAETDWLCFTSANAVEAWFAGLMDLALDARVLGTARVAGVGESTAAALIRHGVVADFTATGGTSASLAHELIATGAIASGTRVVFPRAAGGREELAAVLIGAGAAVEIVSVYDTAALRPAAAEPGPDSEEAGQGDDRLALAEALAALRGGRIDVLCAFAPSQVDALVTALGSGAAEVINNVRLIAAIGPTTEAAAVAAGLRVDVVASRPSAAALVREVAAAYKEK